MNKKHINREAAELAFYLIESDLLDRVRLDREPTEDDIFIANYTARVTWALAYFNTLATLTASAGHTANLLAERLTHMLWALGLSDQKTIAHATLHRSYRCVGSA